MSLFDISCWTSPFAVFTRQRDDIIMTQAPNVYISVWAPGRKITSTSHLFKWECVLTIKRKKHPFMVVSVWLYTHRQYDSCCSQCTTVITLSG